MVNKVVANNANLAGIPGIKQGTDNALAAAHLKACVFPTIVYAGSLLLLISEIACVMPAVFSNTSFFSFFSFFRNHLAPFSTIACSTALLLGFFAYWGKKERKYHLELSTLFEATSASHPLSPFRNKTALIDAGRHFLKAPHSCETKEIALALFKQAASLNTFADFTVSRLLEEAEQQLKEAHLLKAVVEGDREKIEGLLKQKVSCNVADKEGNTPLHHVTLKSAAENVALLLANGARVNEVNCKRQTPLHLAVLASHTVITKSLLTAKADPNSSDLDGNTALHLAAQMGQVENVTDLLANGAEVNKVNKKGQTPLHLAVLASHTAIAKSLLTAKAGPNSGDLDGNTALHLAAQMGLTESITDLLASGAEINKVNKKGQTPLHLAILANHTAFARSLLVVNADPNIQDLDGNTALHLVVSKNDLELVKLVVKKAAIDAQNHRGETALFIATKAEKSATVQLLLDNHADFFIFAKEGEHSLSIATAVILPLFTARIRWKQLKRKRISDLTHEHERLKSISPINRAFTKVFDGYGNLGSILSIKKWVAYGHSLEVWRAFHRDYFVFNHAQPAPQMVINIFVKQFFKKINPHLHEFHLLRDKVFLKDTHPPAWYEENCTKDWSHTDALISADAFLENTVEAESALYYFSWNARSLAIPAADFSSKILTPLVQHYFQKEGTRTTVINALADLMKLYTDTSQGNLYTICVPKNQFHEVGYLAQNFGVKKLATNTQNKQEVERQHLESMQNGNPFSQVRLVTHRLTPERGVKIFLNSSLTKPEKDALKAKIRQITENATVLDKQS